MTFSGTLCLLVGCATVLSLSACQHRSNAESLSCEFDYSTEVRDEIVVPALREWVGDYYVEFDYRTPQIDVVDETTIRIIPPVSGNLMTEKRLVILMDPCENKVKKKYFEKFWN